MARQKRIQAMFQTPDGFGVYQLFAATGQMLYIGRTRNLRSRLQQHERSQPWWPLVTSGIWTSVDNYGEAVALERLAIESDRPLFNYSGTVELQQSVQHLPDHETSELLCLYEDGETSESVDSYMKALHDAGWTLSAIGRPIGITRERVRQRIARADDGPTIEVERYVAPIPKSKQRKVWPTLTDAEVAELKELQPLATKCRGTHGNDHPYRRASERVSELIAEANLRGVRDRDIAAVLGITRGAVRARLKTHGYFRTAPSQHEYGKKLHPSLDRTQAAQCSRGHELDGENVRYINGDPRRRTCRACERIRVERYRARKPRSAA